MILILRWPSNFGWGFFFYCFKYSIVNGYLKIFIWPNIKLGLFPVTSWLTSREAPYGGLNISFLQIHCKGPYIDPLHAVPELETHGSGWAIKNLTDQLRSVIGTSWRACFDVQIMSWTNERDFNRTQYCLQLSSSNVLDRLVVECLTVQEVVHLIPRHSIPKMNKKWY